MGGVIPPLFFAMEDLKSDRIMIYFEEANTSWITLRVSLFHYTIFKTDILDLLGILEMEIPQWLEYIIKRAQNMEARPIPEAPFPQSLPTLQQIRDIIPFVIEPGMAYPVFAGTQIAGLAINPGGDVQTQEIPYRARLTSWKYLGLNFWLQSGMLNGAACLVSQALLYYLRKPLEHTLYPLLDITNYLQGVGLKGAKLWHRPDARDMEGCGDNSIFAHNSVHYISNGNYSIDRYYFADLPLPEVPNGHFLRPFPGQKMKILSPRSNNGRYRLLFEDDYVPGDSPDTVPFGCQPGWPEDNWLAGYNLYNDDSVGIDSFSSIKPDPTKGCTMKHAITDTNQSGQIAVVEEEPTEAPVLIDGGIISNALALFLMLKTEDFEFVKTETGLTPVTYEDEPLTYGGRPVNYGI